MLMRFCYASLLASAVLAASFTADHIADLNDHSDLRLIKTSELDPGTWVSDGDKITQYVAKGIKFVDITDIKDREVLQQLSTRPHDELFGQSLAAAVSYPHVVSHRSEANALIAKVNISEPQDWLRTLTSFHNRYYKSPSGTQAATWLFDTVKSIAAVNPAIAVTQFPHYFNQPSIIVHLPGTTSNTVIVGAHFDSTGGSPTARGPGGDDNGSGAVTVLEALRVLASVSYKSKNTLEFHFYAGEEGGLLGSQAIFRHYKRTGRKVIAFMNQDQTGYSPSGKISVWDDYSDRGLNAFVKKVVVAYGGGSFTTDTCGYACSDHASAYVNGFPAVYVCDEPDETSSPYVHSAEDTYETVMWDAVLRHVNFTVGFLVEGSYF